jgi:hypothetical protein
MDGKQGKNEYRPTPSDCIIEAESEIAVTEVDLVSWLETQSSSCREPMGEVPHRFSYF